MGMLSSLGNWFQGMHVVFVVVAVRGKAFRDHASEQRISSHRLCFVLLLLLLGVLLGGDSLQWSVWVAGAE